MAARRRAEVDASAFPELDAVIPGQGRFVITAAAAEMLNAFGGRLHCYEGAGGCRKRGLYFSRTEPKKVLRCVLSPRGPVPEAAGPFSTEGIEQLELSVSHELAPLLDGATLDFGTYTGRQRFVWVRLPRLKTPSCTCLRSIGQPAGKRSPCLDDLGVVFRDL